MAAATTPPAEGGTPAKLITAAAEEGVDPTREPAGVPTVLPPFSVVPELGEELLGLVATIALNLMGVDDKTTTPDPVGGPAEGGVVTEGPVVVAADEAV